MPPSIAIAVRHDLDNHVRYASQAKEQIKHVPPQAMQTEGAVGNRRKLIFAQNSTKKVEQVRDLSFEAWLGETSGFYMQTIAGPNTKNPH